MLEKFIVLVKSQIAHYQRQIERFPPDSPKYRPDQVAMYRRLVKVHQELMSYLESLAKGDNSPPQDVDPPPQDAGDPEDLSDLPEELLKQLSDTVTKDSTDPLVEIIKDRGGTANLDEVLIDLYRKHGEIGKRTQISNRLYRLAQRHRVWKVKGKKGIYTTNPPPPKKDPASEVLVQFLKPNRPPKKGDKNAGTK